MIWFKCLNFCLSRQSMKAVLRILSCLQIIQATWVHPTTCPRTSSGPPGEGWLAQVTQTMQWCHSTRHVAEPRLNGMQSQSYQDLDPAWVLAIFITSEVPWVEPTHFVWIHGRRANRLPSKQGRLSTGGSHEQAGEHTCNRTGRWEKGFYVGPMDMAEVKGFQRGFYPWWLDWTLFLTLENSRVRVILNSGFFQWF